MNSTEDISNELATETVAMVILGISIGVLMIIVNFLLVITILKTDCLRKQVRLT